MYDFLYYITVPYGVRKGVPTDMSDDEPRDFIIIIFKYSSKRNSKGLQLHSGAFTFTQAY